MSSAFVLFTSYVASLLLPRLFLFDCLVGVNVVVVVVVAIIHFTGGPALCAQALICVAFF